MISRPTAFTVLLGLSLFSVQAAAANNTYILGDPCTTVGETHISSDQTGILACLKKDKNQGAVQSNLFWKRIGGTGTATIECTVGEIVPNPPNSANVTIRPGGDPTALTSWVSAPDWGGKCLNGYVLTGCTMATPGSLIRRSKSLKDGATGGTTTLNYLDITDPSISSWDIDVGLDSSNQVCNSNEPEYSNRNPLDITCCHVVMK